jgi:hypothetical protein
MASVGEVLAALGTVAGCVDRAAHCVADARSQCGDATGTLTEALAGCRDPQAGDALAGMSVATGHIDDVATLLGDIAHRLGEIVGRIRGADGTVVPLGARAARSPVAGRTHPTNTPPPPVEQRDHEWAAQVGAQLTEWERGQSTEALVFDVAGQDWQVNSGVDAELTAAARAVIENMIAESEVGTSPDIATNQAERTALRRSALHAETKVAAWAAANGKRFVDVVTNRDLVCGQRYEPGVRSRQPGCAQAIEAILPVGYRMRVWRRGLATPMVIVGRGKKG